jgi:hypothetical protein
MKGDFTRLTFNPDKHYRAVLMQQGRALLDSDWNEQVQIAEHRYSTFFSDFVGQSGAPAGDALRLEAETVANTQEQTGRLLIKKGRYYVDGLLVENEHEIMLDPKNDLTTVLVDGQAVTFAKSGPQLLEGQGAYLFYLDVWSRNVAAVEDPDLREPALGGPDTTSRVKTEWKVRWRRIDDKEGKIDPKPYGQHWPPSASDTGLSVSFDTNAGSRLDNRLYRVEIYQGNVPIDQGETTNKPTFIWSADNGATAASVLVQDNTPVLGNVIRLDETTARVAEMFPENSWIEVLDTLSTLNGEAGRIAQVISLNGSELTVTWEKSGTAERSWRSPIIVRRWDSKPTPISAARSLFALGNSGIKINLTGERFRTGDSWLIPVRTNAPHVLGWPDVTTPRPPAASHAFAPIALMYRTKDGHMSFDPSLPVLFQPLTKAQSQALPSRQTYMSMAPALINIPPLSNNDNTVTLAWSQQAGAMILSVSQPPSNKTRFNSPGFMSLCLPDNAVVTMFRCVGGWATGKTPKSCTITVKIVGKQFIDGTAKTVATLTSYELSSNLDNLMTSDSFTVNNTDLHYYISVDCSGEFSVNNGLELVLDGFQLQMTEFWK